MLEQRLEAVPEDRIVSLVLADYYQRSGKRPEAIHQFEQLAAVANGDPTVLNNLAWLYYESGNSRATEFARRAYEAAPKVGEIADTYGWILFRGGQVTQGLRVLEKASGNSPDNIEIRYHLAAAHAATGDKKRATEMLMSLLQSDEHFASRTDAEALLRTLKLN